MRISDWSSYVCSSDLYWLSAITQKVGLSPKAPFVAAEGQIEGREGEWSAANTENRAVLQYKAIDVNGTPLPAPKRQEPSQIEHGMMAMLPILQQGVQTSLGMFKASVGDSESQQHGRAILAQDRKRTRLPSSHSGAPRTP